MTILLTHRVLALLVTVFIVGETSTARDESPHQVTIVGTDYAFAVPPTLEHGPTAFSFENRGSVRHEMNLVRLKPGVTLDSLLHTPAGPARRALVEGGGLLLAE